VQKIEKENATIQLIGLADAAFTDVETMIETFYDLSQNTSDFTIMLAHRPEHIKVYARDNIDLVFSGHAHGGQVRMPFTSQGIIAPGQGFFPKYTEGVYTQNNTNMVVSRGLGPSVCPIRLFNRPELVVVTLEYIDKSQ
jgi:predicted MPP superfamily phosphohydrolase